MWLSGRLHEHLSLGDTCRYERLTTPLDLCLCNVKLKFSDINNYVFVIWFDTEQFPLFTHTHGL